MTNPNLFRLPANPFDRLLPAVAEGRDLNPLLQALPRLPLVDLPASQYRIRKAQQAHQLSSFEASVAALVQLHALGGAQADGLQAVFQAWLGAQSSSAPPR